MTHFAQCAAKGSKNFTLFFYGTRNGLPPRGRVRPLQHDGGGAVIEHRFSAAGKRKKEP
jgi:hypothetical protein